MNLFLDTYMRIDNVQIMIINMILTVVGMYGIFIKVGEPGIIALIPHVHWIKFGELIGHEKLGMATALTGIIKLMMVQMLDVPDVESAMAKNLNTFAYYGMIAFIVIYGILRFILFYYFVEDTAKSRWWLLVFAFFPGITLACWGLNQGIELEI